jgi:CheY-like chemotaxis protein
MAKIVLIDHCEEGREVIQTVLAGHHQVYAVESWVEANQHLYHNPPELILVELDLPVIPGDQIASILLRSSNGRLSVALISSGEEETLRARAEVVGVPYVQRTSSPRVLRQSIERLLTPHQSATG